ncbi:MAG: hypothetical protein IH607_04015, partial [Firmicutes bacterium]|nr:hypothetical protein [Bacillota bacterium]
MNAKKFLALVLCILLMAGAAGGAAAEGSTLMERMGETMVNVLVELAGTPGDTAEVGDWISLKLAAMHRKTDIVVTADITYGEGEGTIVFSAPVTLRSQAGERYTIDGNGKQILCVQPASADTPLSGLTLVENLVFTGGSATTEFSDIYATGSGGALFVMGDVKLVNCALTGNAANYGAAVCATGGITLENCTADGNVAGVAGAVYAL